MDLRNTEKLRPDVAKVLVPYLEDLSQVLKDNVLSVVVFGSATGPDFVPGRSDINLTLIVRETEFSLLSGCLKAVGSGFRRRIVAPLFLTKEYVARSADVFPIEFLDIRETGVVLYGEDVFKDFVPDPLTLRHECEQQVRSNLLRTRQAFLEMGLAKRGLEGVLTQSLNSLVPVFRALIVLKAERTPRAKRDIVVSACRQASLPSRTLESVLELRGRKKPLPREESLRLMGDYMESLKKMAAHVDSLRIREQA